MPIQLRRVGRLAGGTLAGVTLLGTLSPAAFCASADESWPVYDRVPAASTTLTLRVAPQVSNQQPLRVRVALRPRSAFEPGRLHIRSGHRTLLSLRVERARDLRGRLELPRLARAGTHRLRAAYRPIGGTRIRSAPVQVVSNAGCAWRPRACGFPDASNTGPKPGMRLRDVPGDLTSGRGWHVDDRGWIEVGDGAVVNRIRTTMPLSITGSGVTVQNSEIIVSGDQFAVQLRHSERVRIVRNIIRGPAPDAEQRLICGIKDMYGDVDDVTIARNEIRYASTGIQVGAGRVRGNYLHDFGLREGDHINGLTSNGAYGRLVVRRNTILNQFPQTDAVGLFQDFGVESDRLITDNLLAGGGYVIYGGQGHLGRSHDIVITDNRISQIFYRRGGRYGPIAHFDHRAPGNVFRGNVWDASGRRVH